MTFCVINFAILISTFFIFPETAGRSLEEMDHIFARASKINPYDVVLIEKRTERRYDHQGKPIALHHHDDDQTYPRATAFDVHGASPFDKTHVAPDHDADVERAPPDLGLQGKKESSDAEAHSH